MAAASASAARRIRTGIASGIVECANGRLAVVTFLSFPLVFIRWPITRDVPWVNLLLLGLTVWVAITGFRRALAASPGRPLRLIAPGLAAAATFAVLGFWVFTVFVASRRLPESAGSPRPGDRAPQFTLANDANESVSLSRLLSDPGASRGVLLIFYRGYW